MTRNDWEITLTDLQLGAAETEAVRSVLSSGWLSQGPVIERFEDAFARFVGARYAIAVSSGTAALHLAYRALGVGPGDEVLCPSMTFVATASAILYCGASPIFLEIQGFSCPVPDPRDLEAKITDRTKCVAIVDYGGYGWDIEAICRVAHAAGLAVVEDAAHALGAERNGRKFGTFGDIGCFSFFSNKNMTTGEGGMVVTDDEGYAAKIRLLRSHGMTTTTWERHRSGHAQYDVVDIGHNYRMDEMRAALGLVQLSRLAGYNRTRRELASRYWNNLSSVDGLDLPFRGDVEGSACHIMPVLLPQWARRVDFVPVMHEHGIQTSHHYPPVHTLSVYRRLCRQELPITEAFAVREVTLPLHPFMDVQDVDLVCERLDRVLEVLR